MDDSAGYARLDDQIDWYDKRSSTNKRWYSLLKILVIVMGALIPFSSGFLWSETGNDSARWISAIAGFAILIGEGLQHVFQYQRNWLSYRATAEALKHEKFLFVERAGHYAEVDEPRKLLVEQVELLISQEHRNWATAHRRSHQAGC